MELRVKGRRAVEVYGRIVFEGHSAWTANTVDNVISDYEFDTEVVVPNEASTSYDHLAWKSSVHPSSCEIQQSTLPRFEGEVWEEESTTTVM